MRETVPVLAAVAAALALAACGGGEKDQRGLDYMPDMYESPAYKSQQAMTVAIRDGQAAPMPVMAAPSALAGADVRQVPAMLPPPAGTVPRDFLPYQLAADDWAGAKALVDPVAPTRAVLMRGRRDYGIYCAVCHGNDGNPANAHVGAFFSGVLPLNGPNLANLSDGEIYHILTHGRGRMPDYRAQLLPERRWGVVQYVRVLNRAAIATTDTAAALQAAEEALAAKPGDAEATAAVTAARAAHEGAQRDLALIRDAGDGAGFAPPADPVPEYVKPSWPEAAP